MPELPEVQTTVNGIRDTVVGRTVTDVWTDLFNPVAMYKGTVKDKEYFTGVFKKAVIGQKIVGSRRRAKNILIDLEGGITILIHMKMTGHVMYGRYEYSVKKNSWAPKPGQPALADPFNRFIHVVFTLDNGCHLALCDMRKFAKVTLVDDKTKRELEGLGIDPFDEGFTKKVFIEKIQRFPNAFIKTALLDQRLVVGIGNIYSDEILHAARVLPGRKVSSLSEEEMTEIHKHVRPILKAGIDFGGDSMSDYRNIYGERGTFQGKHKAYRRTGKPCTRKGCTGTIARKVLNARSSHFCPICQR